MSNKVSTLVYSKLTGSMARKGILGYMADKASDDGSGIWCSKQTIAAEVECSKQTVITTMRGLVADGLITEVGQRKARNGYTVEYRIELAAVRKLPDAKGDGDATAKAKGPNLDGSKGLTSKGQAALPKPSGNPPLEEANASSAPDGAEKVAALPDCEAVKGKADGWAVPPIADLPAEAQAIVRQWPAGAYDTLGAGHAAWLKGKRRVRDRDSSWHARIVQLGDQPIRAAKAGLRYGATTAAAAPMAPAPALVRCDTSGEGLQAAALRAALRETCGAAMYGQWFEPCRYDLDGDRLTVVAPKAVVRDWLRNNREGQLTDAASLILGTRASVEWRLDATA
jgi:hypothetical protein